MNLEQWVDEQVRAAKEANQPATNRKVLEALAEKSGVSYMTLAPVANGARMGNYHKARAVSQATGWKVTIPELCGDKAITPEIQAQFNALTQIAGAA